MSSLLLLPRAGLHRVQRHWARRPAWSLQGTLLACLDGAVTLAGFSPDLAPWLMKSLWAVLLVFTGILVQRNVDAFFGPVLAYDLVRTARRGRHLWLRIVYASALLVMLYLVWSSSFAMQFTSLRDVFTRVELPIGLVAEFAETFCLNFLAVQYAAVLLLTPVYTAGAIAEEKECRTLDYVLSTDLLSHEVVLGKLGSRLSSLALLVLAGLPILSLTQFFGGVDLGLLLAGFAGTLLTLISLGCLSIYISVREPRTLDAVFWTYFYAGVYLLTSGCIPVLNWGNPAYILYELGQPRGVATTSGSILLDLLGNFTLFHGTAAVLLATLAIRRLRPVDQRELPLLALHRHRSLPVNFPPRIRRPRLGQRSPLLWKEIHAEPQVGSHRLGAALMYFFLVLGWFLVVFALVYLWLSWGWNRYLDESPDLVVLRELANGHLAPVLSFLGCAMLLIVALTAAGTVSREKAQQTLDSLLTAPFPTEHILLAKWVGAVLSVRAIWWCVGSLLLLGLITGGIHFLAIPLYLLDWTAQAVFVAAVGLWFSIRCASTLRASTLTLGTVLVVIGLGPVALRLLLEGSGQHVLSLTTAREWGVMLEAALAPQQSLFSLIVPHGGLLPDNKPLRPELLASLFSPLIYGGAAALLWPLLRRNFLQLAGRIDDAPGGQQPPLTAPVAPLAQPVVSPVG